VLQKHGLHSTFYSFRASAAHIMSPYLLQIRLTMLIGKQ